MKLLVDTDPGVDDAMVLLMALASPELEILEMRRARVESTASGSSIAWIGDRSGTKANDNGS